MPDELESVAAREAEETNNWGVDGQEPDAERDAFLEAIDDTIAALNETGIDHLFIGGIASTVLGRPRVTHDLDLLVRPEDARRLLAALEQRGFAVEERAPHWLYKAYRDQQVVDLIFRSSGDIYLDSEMVERAIVGDFCGREVQLLSPEDLVVLKAIAHQEHSPRHWFDALCVLAEDLDWDWDYLVSRARKGPRRVLSLLLYAQSTDLPVPDRVIVDLLETCALLPPGTAPEDDA